MKVQSSNRGVCEESVFADFFSSHVKSLRNYLYYKFGNPEQANDVAQEAFIKLWENCADVPAEKARSFVYKVANNTTLNQIAHQKVVLNFAKKENPSHHTNENPEYLIEHDEFQAKLNNAIAKLTEAQRVAFLMSRIDGKKYNEIADILQISVKAVEKRIHGALVALRENIGYIR